MTKKEIVTAYLQAQKENSPAECRAQLATSFHFKGPIEEHHGADTYMESFGKFVMMIKGIEIHQLIEEGNEVVAVYDFITEIPSVERTRTAEVFTVENGEITKSRCFFDTPEWRTVMQQQTNN